MRRGVTFGQALAILWRGTVRGTCPSCGLQSMFTGWIDMYERCPRCGLRYEVESGAWLGTLAIGYAVGALVAVALTVSEVLWHPLASLGLSATWVIAIAALASSALTYRQSKGLWFALLWLYEFTSGGNEAT